MKKLDFDFDWTVHQFIAKYAKRYQKRVFGMTSDVANLVERYCWPGSLEELSRVLEYAVLASKKPTLGIEDLPVWFLENVSRQIYLESVGDLNCELTFSSPHLAA